MTRPTIIRPTPGRGTTKRSVLTVTVLAGAGLALAACGSSATTGSSGTASNAAATSQSGIHVAKTSLGKVLVDGNGFTVYTFTADSMNKSNCDAACLHFWGVVTPQAKGVKAGGVMAKLGSTQATDGSPIATVNGMPIYTFTGDHSPGDVLGQNQNKFGGRWYVVSPAGQPIKAGGGSSSSGGGGGYGSGGGYGGY